MTGPEPRRGPHWREIVVTALAVAFVARMTLTSQRVELPGSRAAFTCLLGCRDESLRDLLSNILLFLPLGWALRHWLRPAHAIGLCLLATTAIEVLQATVIVGRDSTLRDILSNTAGGALGAWLFDHWRELGWPSRGRSAALGTLAAGVWAGILALSAVGNRLAPSNRPWYGQWSAELAYYARYPGTLLSVDLAGWKPANDRLTEPVPLRDAMRRDSFLLTVRAVSGAEPRRAAPMFSVCDDQGEEQVFVGQDRIALWLHLRNRFESWELRGLVVRLPFFPGRAAGDTVTVEAGLAEHALVLRAVSATQRLETRLPQTVGWGWASMLPFRYAIWDEWLLFNPLWLAGLILPVGYWFGRGSPWAGLAVTAVALVAGLALVPLIADAAPTTRPEWAGGVGGAALGWAVGLWSRRLRPPAQPGAP